MFWDKLSYVNPQEKPMDHGNGNGLEASAKSLVPFPYNLLLALDCSRT